MGFSGVIITDSMGMGALKKGRTIADAAVEAFNAGADILLFGADRGYEEQEHFVIYEALWKHAGMEQFQNKGLMTLWRKYSISRQRPVSSGRTKKGQCPCSLS
jgi:beta-glucosidase-like glycosyl hydrolase